MPAHGAETDPSHTYWCCRSGLVDHQNKAINSIIDVVCCKQYVVGFGLHILNFEMYVFLQGKPGFPGLAGQKGNEGSVGRDGQPGLDGFQGPQVGEELHIWHNSEVLMVTLCLKLVK